MCWVSDTVIGAGPFWLQPRHGAGVEVDQRPCCDYEACYRKGSCREVRLLDKAVGSLDACRVPVRTSQVLAFSESTVVVVPVEAP